MRGGRFLLMLAAGACAQAGPARAASVECLVSAGATAGIDHSEACSLVRERTLLLVGSRRSGADIRITLDLSRRGTAVAHVRETVAGAVRDHPEVAVDVMDRALGRGDLLRLADTVAAALTAADQN